MSVQSGEVVSPVRRQRGPFWEMIQALFSSPGAVVGAFIFVATVILALAAPLIVPQNPYDLMQIDLFDGNLPPMSPSSSLDITYVLGTDDQGRDMWSAIAYGLRISLLVGIVSTLIACTLGTTIGLFAAYVGGRVETLIMRIVDLQLSFPAILVALMILAILGPGIGNVVIAIVIVEWAAYARTVRSAAMVERRREYMEAAECLGLSKVSILFRHLLPNCLSPIIVIATMQIARAISLEATLSFLGLGVPITEPSLGLLIANGYKYILAGNYWVSLFPGLALLIVIVAINLIGDDLREVLNPRRQAR